MHNHDDIEAIKRVHGAARACAVKMGAESISDDVAQEVALSFIFGTRKVFRIRTAVIDALRKLLGDMRNKKHQDKHMMPIEKCRVASPPYEDQIPFEIHPNDRRFFFLRFVCGFSWDELIDAKAFTFHECVMSTRRIKESIKKELMRGNL
jgi:hypothetical protein